MFNYDLIIKYRRNFQFENWILNIRYRLFSNKNQNLNLWKENTIWKIG
jgi:hypothetical protein